MVAAETSEQTRTNRIRRAEGPAQEARAASRKRDWISRSVGLSWCEGGCMIFGRQSMTWDRVVGRGENRENRRHEETIAVRIAARLFEGNGGGGGSGRWCALV